jgi:hypothetical protein
MMKRLAIGVLAITMAMAGCSSDSSGGEGEGEGNDGEGEGVEGEGEEGEGEEGEGEEGEGEEGEGEEGEGEEGEGEPAFEICDNDIDDGGSFLRDCADPTCDTDPSCALDAVTIDLGDQSTPTPVDLPFSEVVANATAGSAECVSVAVPEGLVRLTASAENPRCLDGGGSGDIEVYVYGIGDDAGEPIDDDDDGGEGNCALLATTTLPAGDYVVCVAHFSYANGNSTQPLVATTFSVNVEQLTVVLADGDCSDSATICDPEVVGLECLSVNDPTDLRCVFETSLELGASCVPDTTAAVCEFPAVCNADSSVCETVFGPACEDAEEATVGANTINMPEMSAPGGLSCFETANVFTYYRYTPTENGVVTATVSGNEDAVVGIRQGCNDLSVSCFSSEALAVVGEDIVFSVEAPPGATVTLTITNEPFEILAPGAECEFSPTFGLPEAICETGTYCNGTCVTAEPLVLDVATPFASVEGTPSELCFAFSDAGTYTLTTSGGCSSMNDTQVRVITDGIVVDRDDDGVGGGSRCSTLTLTVEDGNHLACVSHFTFDGDVAGVDFLVTLE